MKIIFICTGNTCRSPMACALFQKQLQERRGLFVKEEFQISSAGLFTHNGLPASPEAIEVMRKEGIDISMHRSSRFRASLIKDTDLILTMTVSQRDYLLNEFPEKSEIIYTLNEFTGDEAGEVLDPYGQDLKTYRQSLSQLKFLVDKVINIILESN